ncbi:hydrolase [Ovoidimarina sediminis]|uniref:hydrolase n=1 Tax=Ovoidimarina sediminis TaxID=3079856 RepID=UPI002911C580|nr:hydrolase [Rhodophyticola sp. MJ-SS7]MDU8942366.1 hydrolase [Rhodophyticola sp. MJ-SS7]
MDINVLPHYDAGDNPTGCCPRFNPEGWEGRNLHFRDKRFLRATSRSIVHVPVNIGRVFERVDRRVTRAHGWDPDDIIVLSRDLSPWETEHLFAVSRDIPGEEMVTLSGDFITHVFEGPYGAARNWVPELERMVLAKGLTPKTIYFFYTTCPDCAKVYGRNYVVGVVEV